VTEHSENQLGDHQDLFCADLPSTPIPEMGKILVAGASGYIGGRLVPELLARGYSVRVMVRGNASQYKAIWPDVEVVVAEALDLEQLHRALKGIDTAYYLIHSLLLGPTGFESADMQAAANFRFVAGQCHLRRMIYLGGLGDTRTPLSSHLRNRMEVANELLQSDVPVTVLRAAVIIGSGSASYEMIQHLVRKVPVIIVPRCALNLCQPISIRDVIKYLVGVLEVPETAGKSFDIGGNEVLSYRDMLASLADILGKNRWLIPIPFSWLTPYAYGVSLLTPVPNAITQSLIKGLVNEVVCQSDEIRKYLPFEPLSYREAVIRALSREEQDRVYTRWSDAYPPAHELALKLSEIKGEVTYIATDSLLTDKSADSLFHSVCRVGGREGWFHGTWMWRLRGMLDRILMGVGTARGRKRRSHLEINDVLDFWRIEDILPGHRLLLRAEMKLPGRAWLEFRIKRESDRNRLSVIAYFDTRTFAGQLYWYACMPFHHYIFRHLIEGIEKRIRTG
jgi:uncharacterized protein YbjT (DUF2867 family)